MNTSFQRFAIRTLAVSLLAAAALSSANAAIFIRTGVVLAPAPMVVSLVVAAPVVVAPVMAAPVVVAPVMVVPTCRFVAVPVMNAWTGFTYMVTRRVCN
jgi:2-oxoglutarate dehydrogenase E2 component (dihydrolipoamide succinyltransferase)